MGGGGGGQKHYVMSMTNVIQILESHRPDITVLVDWAKNNNKLITRLESQGEAAVCSS